MGAQSQVFSRVQMTSATYQSWSEKCEEIVWKIFKSFDVNGDSVVNKTEYDAVVKDEKVHVVCYTVRCC